MCNLQWANTLKCLMIKWPSILYSPLWCKPVSWYCRFAPPPPPFGHPMSMCPQNHPYISLNTTENRKVQSLSRTVGKDDPLSVLGWACKRTLHKTYGNGAQEPVKPSSNCLHIYVLSYCTYVISLSVMWSKLNDQTNIMLNLKTLHGRLIKRYFYTGITHISSSSSTSLSSLSGSDLSWYIYTLIHKYNSHIIILFYQSQFTLWIWFVLPWRETEIHIVMQNKIDKSSQSLC